MGAYWLHNALAPLSAKFGDKLVLLPGYEFRSRSTGGFEKICGIVNHHDADQPGGEDVWAVNYCYFGAADRPVGNFHVTRKGLVYWGAAGASNHAGKGGAVSTSKGTVPLNLGNKYLIGIEASNSGVGESWPDVQLEAIINLDVVLCKTFGLNPLTDIFTHAGWCQPSCPGRKIDPAGPTPKYPKFGGTSGAKTWVQNELRKEVNAHSQASPTPSPVTDWVALGATYPTPPGDPYLEQGVIHANVPWLQAVLCSMPRLDNGKPIYDPNLVHKDTINGVVHPQGFGPATKSALAYWQTHNSLLADGEYGKLTAARMYEVRKK